MGACASGHVPYLRPLAWQVWRSLASGLQTSGASQGQSWQQVWLLSPRAGSHTPLPQVLGPVGFSGLVEAGRAIGRGGRHLARGPVRPILAARPRNEGEC